MHSNPFRYTAPVPPEDLVDRDDEANRLVRLAVEGNNSRLVAPRRYGKTSLLRRVESEMPQGWQVVLVDFFGVLTIDDVARRIERAYAEQLTGRLSTWFTSLLATLRPTFRAGGGPVPASVEVTPSKPGGLSLLDCLTIPRRLHERHGRRVLIIFDEFQDVLAAEARIDATIRSEIQHHADVASYIFAGSQVGMMEKLFGDRRRAFYGQATPVDLGPLDHAALGEHIAERFAQTNRDTGVALGPLLDLVKGHPQRAMLVAHALWDATQVGQVATEEAWTGARQRSLDEVRDELRAVWTGLPTGQRRVLATLASPTNTPLYASRRQGGGSRGGAVSAAVRALMDRGEVSAGDGGYEIVDPLLAAWVGEGTPT
ncbi:MAG: AAA family ATPase [Acidimicrobiales bacterium]